MTNSLEMSDIRAELDMERGGASELRQWTILFRPDFDRRLRIRTGSAPSPMERRPRAGSPCEHHRRWGLPPRPESRCIVNVPRSSVKGKRAFSRDFRPVASFSCQRCGQRTFPGPEHKKACVPFEIRLKDFSHILRRPADRFAEEISLSGEFR